MSDREKLLDLIKNFLEQKLPLEIFSNSFTILFSREINLDILTEQEFTLLSTLEEIVSFFFPHAEERVFHSVSKEDVQRHAAEALAVLSE